MAPVSALRITFVETNALLYELNDLGGTTVDNFELDELKFNLLVSFSILSTVPHRQAPPVVVHPYVLPLNLFSIVDSLLCPGALELQVVLL